MGDGAIGRRVRTRLTERRQAQEALDSDELFEALTCEALLAEAVGEEAVADEAPRQTLLGVSRGWRRLAGGAIAAGLALAGYLAFWPRADTRVAGVPTTPAPTQNPAAAKELQKLRPIVGRRSNPDQPILLASRLPPPGSSESSVLFRGGASAARAPQQEGRIEEIDGETVVVSLGSEDGLRKGTELNVVDEAGRVRHTLVAYTVFRSTSRATVKDGGSARVQQTVRTGTDTYWIAALQHLDALIASGAMEEAKSYGRTLITWAEPEAVPRPQRTRALLRLGLAEYYSGSTDHALRHLEQAVGSTSLSGELDPAIETLAAIQIARGDPHSAEKTLGRLSARQPSIEVLNSLAAAYLASEDTEQAARILERITKLGKRGPVVMGQVLNNRGVLEEVRGNKEAARRLYEDARGLFGHRASAAERLAVESNLVRLDKN